MVISLFYDDINDYDILFKFCIEIVSIMGKIVVVFICFFRIFAQSYSCCPQTFGTALICADQPEPSMLTDAISTKVL